MCVHQWQDLQLTSSSLQPVIDGRTDLETEGAMRHNKFHLILKRSGHNFDTEQLEQVLLRSHIPTALVFPNARELERTLE